MTGDWVQTLLILIPVLTASAVQIIAAVRTKEVHRQVVPPSNGRTLGQLMESTVNSSHAAAIDSARIRNVVVPSAPAPVPPIDIPEGIDHDASQAEQRPPAHLQDQLDPGPTVPEL